LTLTKPQLPTGMRAKTWRRHQIKAGVGFRFSVGTDTATD